MRARTAADINDAPVVGNVAQATEVDESTNCFTDANCGLYACDSNHDCNTSSAPDSDCDQDIAYHRGEVRGPAACAALTRRAVCSRALVFEFEARLDPIMRQIKPSVMVRGSVGLLCTMLTACLTPVDDVPAPPANPAISNAAGSVTLPSRIECDGPAEELALLGKLCGTETALGTWMGTDAEKGMSTAFGSPEGPVLLLYNRLERDPGSANVAGEVKYSAYVLLSVRSDDVLRSWSRAEPVSSGQVTSQLVRFEACSASWFAEGTFTWRSTTLRLAWGASRPC